MSGDRRLRVRIGEGLGDVRAPPVSVLDDIELARELWNVNNRGLNVRGSTVSEKFNIKVFRLRSKT